MMNTLRQLFLAALFAALAACGGPGRQVLGPWNDEQGYHLEFLRNGQVIAGDSEHGTWTVAENGDIVVILPDITLRGQVNGDELTLRTEAGAIVLTRADQPVAGSGRAEALRVSQNVATAAPAADMAAPSVAGDVERNVVRVIVTLQTNEGRMLYGSGSGFAVGTNLVVTNAHVVAPAQQRPDYAVAVVPPNGEGLVSARVIKYSPLNELALLELQDGPALSPLTISTAEPQAGDRVVALGYPDVDYQGASGADLVRPSVASRDSGEIASLRDRAPTGDAIPTINHTAVISSGSSGGPLLDACGRVIGVNAWHVSGADTRETRGVSTRTGQLLQFLAEAHVAANASGAACAAAGE